MATPQGFPPWWSYISFSIDVAATLDLYCDGGDEAMLQKLDGLEDRKYSGYCMDVQIPREPTYHVISVRPLQQGLTKPHPRRPQHARPTMCVPIFPTTAHPRSREPLEVTKPLSWDNCYHPTCHDVRVRIRTERRDYCQSSYVKGHFSPQLCKAFEEDVRYRQFLHAGLDDDQILRILDGQESAPATDVPDDASETDSLASQMFLAKLPGSDNLEEELCFVPIMRFDHVLSNVPGIAALSQLCGDLDLFQEIVQEYQLARYGSVLFDSPGDLPIDETPVRDDVSSVYTVYTVASAESRASSTEDLSSDSPDSHELDLSLEESPRVPVPVPARKGKWSQVAPPEGDHQFCRGLQVAQGFSQVVIWSAGIDPITSPSFYYIHYFVSLILLYNLHSLNPKLRLGLQDRPTKLSISLIY
ncbi:uncharacterized protein BT62DRAFT_1074667 [Guyanagaster necrorhizus]|uniref:Uncharacterized protein n=1 Tax=Guyanagaster necrorhizus TaxID=856835 RepID=A0A9P7VX07_9AGAR|nr:uncharacterized protein BT62DRAFT_1074667 [Guyanagaster necrorhizus MCA 3950]KAG7448163.1 hypothetical protein BT62DRAFT_1074667 [Guyanagaster necrorhizus MCA 3950]